MYIYRNEKEYLNEELALAFYTYVLYMRIDIKEEKIAYIYEKDNKFYRIILEMEQDKTFKSIIKENKIIEIKNINKFINEEYFIILCNSKKNKLKVQIKLTYNKGKYIFNFLDGFNYHQKLNFKIYFIRMMESIFKNNILKLKQLNILEEEEEEEIRNLYENIVKYDENRTILDHFNEKLNSNCQKVCVTFKNEDYTYEDIDIESEYIANKLFSLGIENQKGIMIFMDRSSKIISSIIATMKCNCYYIPIDISTPIDRVKEIISDSNPYIILTDDYTQKILEKEKINSKLLNIYKLKYKKIKEKNNRGNININGEDYCYIIYTSGTTGKPKAVGIRHKNIYNFVFNNILNKKMKNKEELTIFAVNKIGFDAFVADTLLPLTLGIKIVMASSEDLNDPRRFIKTIRENNVNIIQTTPTRLNLSIIEIEPEILETFKIIICGGEKLRNEFVNKIKRYTNATIINVYGPTETTVWSTCANLTDGEKGIGKPSSNQNCYILNRYKQIIPRYENGIIYISGKGLGEYVFHATNNNSKYIRDNKIKENIYDTGDVGYIDCNNNIIIENRVDSQVKINGVRIELTEIENVALQIPEIKDCVVAIKDIPDIGKRIILYYTEKNKLDNIKIKEYLELKLPTTYIPKYIIKIDKMPITISSKIDIKRLPIPQKNTINEETKITYDQKRIIDIFRKIKSGINININSNYHNDFDSLDLIRLYSEFLDKGYKVNMDTIAKSKTILELSNEIMNSNTIINNNYSRYSFSSYLNSDEYEQILLTGAAGFLGIHILEYLLKTTSSNIICLVRENNELENNYEKYNMQEKYDNKRIEVIKCNLEENNFGLNYYDRNKIKKSNLIINCAGYVNYFGEKEKFENSNIVAVRNLVDFAIEQNIILNHISTLSVLGTNGKSDINEYDFYFGQDINSNQYIESKFLGELELLKGAERGLKYRNFRIGRLGWRKRDNKFQLNPYSNEFYMTLMLFKELKMVPEDIIDTKIEISPVEFCAKAICKLIKIKEVNGNFHVMNNKLVTIGEIISSLNYFNNDIKIVPQDIFMKEFNENKTDIKIKNIICINNEKYIVENNPFIKNDITQMKLKEQNFSWPIIDKEYFRIFRKK